MASKTLEEAQAAFMHTSILKSAVDRLQDELKAVKAILVATQNRLAMAESEKRLHEWEIKLVQKQCNLMAVAWNHSRDQGEFKYSGSPYHILTEYRIKAENAIREEQEIEDAAS